MCKEYSKNKKGDRYCERCEWRTDNRCQCHRKRPVTGTITDIDGRFVLDTPKDAVLQITTSSKVSVSSFNTTLSSFFPETLEEVVVVGYGVQKKANLTGAVSSVKMDEILGDRPVTSVSNVLMGAMPGLQVTGTSGQPGAEMSFNIRGVNSINEGAPLVLVDNVEKRVSFIPFLVVTRITQNAARAP